MSFIAVGIGLAVAGSAVGAISAGKAKRQAERKEAAATEEMNRLENVYSQLDTSNPYADMENTMEDITINQRQFDLQKQQAQQQQEQVLEGTREAAGSSGVGAVASALASQGKLASKHASSTIGMQESENQAKERTMAANLQTKEREGDIMSREWEKDKQGTLLGMSQQEVAAYREQANAAEQAKWDAISGGFESVGSMLVQPGGYSGGSPMTRPTRPAEPEVRDDLGGGIDYDKYISNASFVYTSDRTNYYNRAGTPAIAVDGREDAPISVGAMDAVTYTGNGQERKASFSNSGPRIDVWAAGYNILSPYGSGFQDPRNTNFFNANLNGTSMAAPQVCGVVALYLQSQPHANRVDVRNWIVTHGSTEVPNTDATSETAGFYDPFQSNSATDEDYWGNIYSLKSAPRRILYNPFCNDGKTSIDGVELKGVVISYK